MSVSWVQLERLVLKRVNALRSDDDAAASTLFAQTTQLAATDLQDPAFPLSTCRFYIVDAVNETAALLARWEGSPYRSRYSSVVTVAHGDVLPASLGGYGAIYYLNGPAMVPAERDSPTNVNELRTLPNLFGASPPVPKFALDGVLYAHPSPLMVQCFRYNKVGVDVDGKVDPAAVAALFAAWTSEANLPDEFVQPVADLAAYRFSIQADANLENAPALAESYTASMAALGIQGMNPDRSGAEAVR